MGHNVGNRSEARPLARRTLFLFLIFLTALGFRTCAVIRAPSTPIADAADYHRLAIGLAEGRGYVNEAQGKTAWRPPGYPLFLAAIYRIAGPGITFTTLVQALIGAIVVLLLCLFAGIVIGWREAIVAGFIAAVYPGFIWLPRLLLSENLSLLLLLITLCAAAMYLKTSRIWWMPVFGAVSAVNTLVRGGNLLVPLLIGAGIAFVAIRKSSSDRRRIAAGLLMASATFWVVLTPWILRNYQAFGRFIPVATQDGLTLYASYWPPQKDGKLIWGTLPGNEDPTVVAAGQLGSEVAASAYFQQVTLRRLREQPAYFFRLIPSKLISLLVPLDWEIFPHAEGRTRSVNYGYLLILLPALAGFIALLRERQPHQWLLWVLPVAVLIQAILFYGSPRFRLPAEPIAILLGAVGLCQAYAFLKSRWSLLG